MKNLITGILNFLLAAFIGYGIPFIVALLIHFFNDNSPLENCVMNLPFWFFGSVIFIACWFGFDADDVCGEILFN